MRSVAQARKDTHLLGRLIAACTLLYMMPIALKAPGFGGQVAVYELASALTSVVAIWLTFPQLLAAARQGTTVGLSLCAYLAALAVILARHPAPWAALIAIEIAGAIAIASRVGELVQQGATKPLMRTLFCFVAFQSFVGVAQVVHNGSVLGPWAGETEFGFRRIDGLVGAAGTLTYANVLGIAAAIIGAILLQAIAHDRLERSDRFAAAVCVVLATGLVGLSLCRTAIVAWAVVFVVGLLSSSRRRLAPLLLITFVALALSVAARADGWVSRGKASAAGTETSGSGRMALNRQAVAVFKTEPILGVGLSNYRDTVRRHPEIDALSTEDYVVHNGPLFALATTGLVGIVALIPIIACVLMLAARRGAWGIGLLLFAAPILLLAQQLFVGIGLMWLGLIVGFAITAPSKRISPQDEQAERSEQSQSDRQDRRVPAPQSRMWPPLRPLRRARRPLPRDGRAADRR